MTRMFLLLVIVALVAGACGTPATPEWAAEVEQTQVAQAETAAYETSIAPTATPTNTPSPTPLPPTATPVPPTATPTETPAPPTATFTPSPIPTQAEDTGDTGAAATVDGDPEAGRAAFELMRTEVGFSCAICHHVNQPGRLIGPSLQGIGERAATRIEGQNAVEYLRNSILHPNDYLVEDETGTYPASLMPQTYESVLTEQEINDIIAYLLTL